MPASKPYQNEREANAAPAAKAVIDGFDALYKAHGPGCTQEPNARIMLDVIDAAGVEISEFEHRTFWWLGGWETHHAQIIARVIEAAYEAGRASAMQDTVTEWAIAVRREDGDEILISVSDEERARYAVTAYERSPGPERAVAKSRQVTQWKDAPDD